MENKVEFLGQSYGRSDLQAMGIEELLTLRNLVASNLGVSAVRAFKDHGAAVDQTEKALQKYEAEVNGSGENVATPAKKEKAPKAPKEPKERKPAKSASAGYIKRPTRKMFDTIEKTGEHDGSTHGRAHRWPNYKDGMTIADVIETDGTEQWDVANWAKHGIMRIVPATDEEYTARRAAWYVKHDMVDPDLDKVNKLAEREAAKATKAEELAKKKAEREAAKAVKAEEAAKKKAEREAAKAVKAEATAPASEA